MTTKPWGDEPAECEKSYLENKLLHDRKEYIQIDSYGGFTKLERACIDLKVPHHDLSLELRALILESRRLDYAGQALLGLLQWSAKDGDIVTLGLREEQNIFANASFKMANAMLAEDAMIKLENSQPSESEEK